MPPSIFCPVTKIRLVFVGFRAMSSTFSLRMSFQVVPPSTDL